MNVCYICYFDNNMKKQVCQEVCKKRINAATLGLQLLIESIYCLFVDYKSVFQLFKHCLLIFNSKKKLSRTKEER